MVNRALLALPAVVLLAGCLEVGGFTWRVDVPAKTAHLVLTDLSSTSAEDARGDFRTLVEDWVRGDALAKRYPHATFGERTLRVDGDTLVLDVTVEWTFLTELGWRDWDAARPYRFCPDAGYHVLRANADARDGAGCVVWNADRTSLEAVTHGDQGRVSLLPVYQAWKAAGEPPLDAFVSGDQPR